jgi:hypothetical protein
MNVHELLARVHLPSTDWTLMKKTLAKLAVGTMLVASTVAIWAAAAVSDPAHGQRSRSVIAPSPSVALDLGYTVVTWDSQGTGGDGGRLDLGDGGELLGSPSVTEPPFVCPPVCIGAGPSDVPELSLTFDEDFNNLSTVGAPLVFEDAPPVIGSPPGTEPPFVCPPVCVGADLPSIVSPEVVSVLGALPELLHELRSGISSPDQVQSLRDELEKILLPAA